MLLLDGPPARVAGTLLENDADILSKLINFFLPSTDTDQS